VRILLSNDDGYQSPGIQVLFALLQKSHEVTVVAPDRDRSGASNSLTLDRPLTARQVDDRVYYVNGTPTDCVHLAITGLLENEPDMVVSGINAGPNLGDDVLYSGTVAAAMEGRFLGLPAIAVSSTSFTPEHLDSAASLTLKLIYQLEEDPLPGNMILNLNIPDLPSEQLQGIAVTRLGSRHKAEPVVKSQSPRGEPIYWVGPPGPTQDAGPGTDFHAVKNAQASMTPLHVDLTHHEIRDRVSSWLKHHDN
jgi:5'-nucleotidase